MIDLVEEVAGVSSMNLKKIILKTKTKFKSYSSTLTVKISRRNWYKFYTKLGFFSNFPRRSYEKFSVLGKNTHPRGRFDVYGYTVSVLGTNST